MEKRWLDIAGAAAYTATTPRTIRTAILDGKLARAKLGKRFILSVQELDRWVEAAMQREIEPARR